MSKNQNLKHDDFVKSPTSVLRCLLRHCDVLSVRLIPRDLRALNLELFTVPSSLDFLRDHQTWPNQGSPSVRPSTLNWKLIAVHIEATMLCG
jgi:hypothetical protein